MVRPLPWAVVKKVWAALAMPGQQVGAGLHAAADDDRLAGFAVTVGEARHARAEGAGRPLAVHQQLAALPVDQVLLQLGGVVGHVVDHAHPQILGRALEHPGEDLADAVEDHLAVGEGHVDGALHGREVGLPLRGAERGAGQLPVVQLDAVLGRHDLQKGLQVVGGHLVAEAAAAAVEHDHDLVGDRDAEGPGGRRVEDVLRPGHLDLAVVVAGAEGADLVVAALDGLVAAGVGIGPREAAPLLGQLQVLRQRVAVLHAPARAVLDHPAEFAARTADETAAADPGRNRAEQLVHQFADARPHLLLGQGRQAEAHAAVDVEADAAGRDHAAVRVHRRHAADREAVAPVAVRHAEGVVDDAGQAGHVGDLVEDAGLHAAQQRLRGDDPRRDPHPLLEGDREFPDGIGYFAQLRGQ